MMRSAGVGWILLASACTCGGSEREVATPRPTEVSASSAETPEPTPPPRRQTEVERIEAQEWGDDESAQASLSALRNLAERCDRDLHLDCWLLGDAYERGEAALEPGEDDARRLYRRACRHGGLGCADAGRLHTVAARQHFERGCRQGDAQSCELWAGTLDPVAQTPEPGAAAAMAPALPAAEPADLKEARRLGCIAGWAQGCSEDDEPIEGCDGPILSCAARSAAAQGAEAQRFALLICDGHITAGCARYGELEEDEDTRRIAFERACVAALPGGCRKLLGLLSSSDSSRATVQRRLCALDGTQCPP